MTYHPYFKPAHQEQREEAIERYKIEADRYLREPPRPITGRVLEVPGECWS